MSAQTDQKALPRFAMLLSLLDDEINIDRAALKQAGAYRLRSIRSGQEALRIVKAALSGAPAFQLDFIVCSEDLPDMGVHAFLRELSAIAATSAGPLPPVLFIAPDNQSLNLALAHGASAALVRPYSANELGAAVARLQNLAAAASGRVAEQPEPARPANDMPKSGAASAVDMLFSAQAKKAGEQLQQKQRLEAQNTVSVTRQAPGLPPKSAEAATPVAAASGANKSSTVADAVNPLLYSRTGLGLLRQGKLASAQDFLVKALRFDPLDLEAALGLARLHRENGDEERMHRWMHKAGMICLHGGQPERARAVFAKLPAKWQGDHYMIEAQNLLQDEDFDQACEAFMQLSAQNGKRPHELLGRACQFTSAPEYYIYEMCLALERNGHESTARQLEKRMLGGSDSVEVRPYGFLDHFPRLQEVVTIARFTMRVWRAAA